MSGPAASPPPAPSAVTASGTTSTSTVAGHHRQVLTAERVPLTLPIAGVGERAIATMVDAIILLLVVITVLFIYSVFGRGDLERDISSASQTLLTLVAVVAVVGIVLYDVVADVFFQGRTPGKRAVRLRVVDVHGQPPDLLTSLLRNLLRLVDMLPVGYGVGFIVIFLTGTRRLGDLVAGTMVISERSRGQRPLDLVRAAAGPMPDDDDAGDPTGLQLRDDAVWPAVELIVRSAGLLPGLQEKMVRAALPGLRTVGGLALHQTALATTSGRRAALARAVLDTARVSGSMAARLLQLHQAEDDVVAATARLEQRRRRARRHDAQTASDVDAFDNTLRLAASALLSATRRGVPAHLLEALSLRLLEAERLRQPPPPALGRRLRRFLLVEVPLVVWEERALIGRAAMMLGLAFGVGFGLSYANLEVGRALIGDELMQLVEEGASWTNRIEQQGTYVQASLNIIINNVGVGLRVFALGILGGVATVLGLVWNGVSLGATFGVATRLGTADTLARFILAHGPVELSMICVAGAAGLLLGRAVISPGPRRRLVAIREAGARGARLLTFATIGFCTIGLVEGFISPGAHFSSVANAAVGVGLWLLFFGWARAARR